MPVSQRKYKLLSDFARVSDFYAANYRPYNWTVTRPYFEYAHTHGMFEWMNAHHMGVWEDVGGIVATACFEMGPGLYIPCVKPGYEFLKGEMLRYAESELSKVSDGKRSLEISQLDGQCDDAELYKNNGYTIAGSDPILIYFYDKGFKDCRLPDGFTLISLEDENDPMRIDCCLYEGFDHGEWDEARNWADGRLHAQSGPHFRKDLTTVVKAPNGDYACFAGMWVDDANGFAYLEPLSTRPKYRRMGLAAAALMEGMKKTVSFGAKYCYTGTIDFYRNVGCEEVGKMITWRKEW